MFVDIELPSSEMAQELAKEKSLDHGEDEDDEAVEYHQGKLPLPTGACLSSAKISGVSLIVRPLLSLMRYAITWLFAIILHHVTCYDWWADEWDVNKWAWEGVLKVISKGEECIIRLEDKASGALYARAFLRNGGPHPVEPVIDSSRYFVLRIEENIGGRLRHAFIGIGFRERTQAYDFQAALHDHAKYLNKKKEAEEMEQHYQHTPSVDYSLKEGETLVIPVKNKSKSAKPKVTEGLNNLAIEEKGNGKLMCLKPPPRPSTPVSPVGTAQSLPPGLDSDGRNNDSDIRSSKEVPEHADPKDDQRAGEVQDDDFGDFQAAV